jgi:DNA-binding MarR family transcriptional regulator
MSHLQEFADKMSEIMPSIMKEFASRQASELYKGKITLPQLLILEYLHKASDCTMSEIAHFMRVSTAAVTGFMDRLVRDGYVIRDYDPEDRRIIKAKLTLKGASLVKKIKEQKRQMIISIFGKISQEDRNEYLRILTQIKDILMKDSQTK